MVTTKMPSARTTRTEVIDSFGGPDRFRSAELPLAAPGAGEVQVRVAAAAVNPVDLSTRAGMIIPADAAHFPMTIGWDAAGTIEDVAGWRAGDRVAAMTIQPGDQNGAYTGHINLAADLVARVPDGVSLEQAATIPLAGLTASQMLGWVDVPASGTVLVDAPLGAVGRFAVQLARNNEITVVAVAKPEDRDAVLELGAAEVVGRGDFTAAERDVRLEVQSVHPDTPVLARLLEAVGRGKLTSSIERTYPLAKAAEAHRRQAQGGLRGKLVLGPD